MTSKRNMPAKARRRRLAKIIVEQGGHCFYCDKPIQQNERGDSVMHEHTATIDHVIPTSRGGENKRNNLVGCCYPCNSEKSGTVRKETP